MANQIFYLNGSYVTQQEASTPINNRGLYFGDGIYESVCLFNGKLVDVKPHMERFTRSATSLNLICKPVEEFIQGIPGIILELASRVSAKDGLAYCQISRGPISNPPNRTHGMPVPQHPTTMVEILPPRMSTEEVLQKGITCDIMPDIRWRRRDIKSTNLLGNILQLQQAKDAGFDDVLFEEEGLITEASSANAFMLKGKNLFTFPKTTQILHGITRERIINIASALGLCIVQEAFHAHQVFTADEVFLTNSGSFVRGVSHVSGVPIGGGASGPVTRSIFEKYHEHCSSL